ncbi:MAG: DUF3473 domain-containing protein [Planctomycetota bacterium]|nr:DUF3473 domain-containing protein [Planctomycetota bacterium]
MECLSDAILNSAIAPAEPFSLGVLRHVSETELQQHSIEYTQSHAVSRNVLTVNLEDYFQVSAFSQLITEREWYRFESRLVRNTAQVLELLQRHEVTATFFVLGWIAERWPELLRDIAEAGHEIASRGFYHRALNDVCRSEFQDELSRTRELIEDATGQRVIGFRMSDGWIKPKDSWLLDVLAAENYVYDSSLCPTFWQHAATPERDFVHQLKKSPLPLWEYPISTWRCFGATVPIGGGNYFRQLPHTLLKRAVDGWHRRTNQPFVMYFHAWELDPEQPRISSAGRIARLRHYRNLDKMSWVLEDYFSRHHFSSIVNHLGLQRQIRLATNKPRPERPIQLGTKKWDRPQATESASTSKVGVTIVIPCYNEASTVPYLLNTLESVEYALLSEYRPQFIFIDDCSTDDTCELLRAVVGPKDNVTILAHDTNRGVMAAIQTGIRAAATDIVCSIDCDCSYDPHELLRMIPRLTDGVDLVTASPYHRDGKVKNVPAWRLLLSKGLSQLYRWTLPISLHTYTSCFRVYRKSSVKDLQIDDGGFLGVAELVGRLGIQGGTVVEHPATLEVRLFGESKMKTVRTIFGHLRLIAKLTRERITRRSK